MSLRETYTQLFSHQVVGLVEKGTFLTEVEAEPLVRQWIKGVKEEHRPSITSITMNAKRKLWNLASI